MMTTFKDRRFWAAEDGFTLIEMMISALLISLASILIITLLTSATGIMQGIEVRSAADRQSQIISTTLESDIRSAVSVDGVVPVVEVAKPFELTIYRKTTFNGTPVRHHYYLNGDKMMMGVLTGTGTDPNWSFTGTELGTQIGMYVRNAGANSLFKYYDENGVELVSPTTVTDREKIRKVTLYIICDKDPTKSPQSYSTTLDVNVRNQRSQ
jgi:type II secretory pathway pseudopilin PulG